MMTTKNPCKKTFVHSEIVRELQARRTNLLAERKQLTQAAQRVQEIDETIAAIDTEISRSQALVNDLAAAAAAQDKQDADDEAGEEKA